ncbi:MAG: CHASE3 domain-containing protein [Hyphomicrobium sp.]
MLKSLKSRAPEAAAVLLAVILAVSAWLVLEYRRQMAWVVHTVDVENHIGNLMLATANAETGQRGFLLTREASFLEPYEKGSRDARRELDAIASLTSDNPDQQKRIDALRPLLDERLFLLRQRIEEARAGTLDVRKMHRGKALMDQMRIALGEMRDVENALIDKRLASSRAYMQAAIGGAIAAAILSLTVLAGWILSTRRAGRQLLATNRELVRAIADREAGEAKVRQMQKTEAIGQLTGGIAHDFNNMLSVVIGALGLAQKRLAKGDANIQTFIDGAMDGATRAATLTKRLLAFSRQQPLAPQPIAANALLSGMSDLIVRALGETIETETVLAGGLWTLHADPPQLENAILNLCVNARDAMPDGGKLTIETSNAYLDDAYAAAHGEVTAGQFVMVAVSDTGTGMTPDIIARAFDPFFSTKEMGKGTGLGLSQVHGFVKQSGGHIKIYSEPGNGTTVKMYFPRFIASGAAAETSQGRPAPRIPPGSRDQLILVVEDDPRVRETSVAMLRDLGYSTIHADGATAALRELDANAGIVLMFTDIVMPETNGRKLAEEAWKRRPDLRVLFTTGFTRNAVVHNGVLDAGVQLLQKPFTMNELALKIRAVLDSDVGAPG